MRACWARHRRDVSEAGDFVAAHAYPQAGADQHGNSGSPSAVDRALSAYGETTRCVLVFPPFHGIATVRALFAWHGRVLFQSPLIQRPGLSSTLFGSVGGLSAKHEGRAQLSAGD